jgi:hypothetical protein
MKAKRLYQVPLADRALEILFPVALLKNPFPTWFF